MTVKVKIISRLMYGKYSYAIQISHDALRLKNIRWKNRGNELHKVEPFMYKLSFQDLVSNKSYFGDHRGGWGFQWANEDHVYKTLTSWDKFVEWVNAFKTSNPDCIGRLRHEGYTISFFCTDDSFCQGLLNKFPDICKSYQRIPDNNLLPVLEKAMQDRTWLLQKEYVDHYPYNQYQFRIYLSWEARETAPNLLELFKNYEEADLIKLSGGFSPLLAGTGRLKYPAHILVKTEDILELVKLALGPTAVRQIVEYVLLSNAHSSP